MRFNHLFRVLLSLILLTVCQLARAEPMLNGISVQQELGQEVFIGALYTESLSNNADTLISTNQPARMELKIASAEGMTTRRFSRMWIEGMAINSKADVLTAQADNMVKFDGLFKGRFLKDDHIVFANTPDKGVNISVNGVLLGNIKDNLFFSMLLSTWIGKIPLSSDYRDSLLKVGDVNAALRTRFEGIKPSAARMAEINTWTGAQVAAVTKSSASSKAASSVATAEKPVAVVAAPVAKPVVTPAAPAKAVEEDDDSSALTAQSLLARQFYVSDAIKKIRSKTKYPQRALDRGQAGNVRVGIIIDRQGNIIGTNILENSKFELLNKEAIEAIKRSAPFPALPAEIAGARFEFSVPMRWTLPE
ncbi:MAG: TonB family protein [Cellvibrio sp.]|uniref:TonB family protein n=1 Tax=Cellvibrio sp. TaxID=1965322 RepID=UPI0031AF711D